MCTVRSLQHFASKGVCNLLVMRKWTPVRPSELSARWYLCAHACCQIAIASSIDLRMQIACDAQVDACAPMCAVKLLQHFASKSVCNLLVMYKWMPVHPCVLSGCSSTSLVVHKVDGLQGHVCCQIASAISNDLRIQVACDVIS
eukprot:scaffold181935_cov19-Tisochrysis_lutea.AAC.1